MNRASTPIAALAALVFFATTSGCGTTAACGDCAANESCINGECLPRRSCEAVSCPGAEQCLGGFCFPPDAEPERIDGGRDAGVDDRDAGFDSGIRRRDATIERLDAGPPAPDAGPLVDAGPDAGNCTCTPNEVVARVDCGVCGQAEVICERDCQTTTQGACGGDDSRCTDPLAPHCRNDYCWGMFATHETGMSDQCVDMATDYVPADGAGSGVYGTLDVVVRGRPGAAWVRQNRYVSCGVSSQWVSAEEGTLDSGGRDDSPPFEYGATDCDLDTLGRHNSRVIFSDPGLPDVVLLSNPTRLYNSACTSDRNSCADTDTFCSAS